VRAHRENLRYLRTKRDRMGHDLPDLEPPPKEFPAADQAGL
jgi:3,4-dihydroxy 2-butanone 4-phosphate synthase/GTP cyclohydrolase II